MRGLEHGPFRFLGGDPNVVWVCVGGSDKWVGCEWDVLGSVQGVSQEDMGEVKKKSPG